MILFVINFEKFSYPVVCIFDTKSNFDVLNLRNNLNEYDLKRR